MFKGKKILIGITGGIAAYKICELIRMYNNLNSNVKYDGIVRIIF